MEEIIKAIYENGVLRPLKPLKLREGQKLKIRVYTTDIVKQTERFRKKITPENFKESPEEYLLKLREERV